MYYAGLRPEEAINLTADNVILPPQVVNQESRQGQDPPGDEGWGELHIRVQLPMQAASGRMMGARGTGGSSSTAPRETAGSCRSIPS